MVGAMWIATVSKIFSLLPRASYIQGLAVLILLRRREQRRNHLGQQPSRKNKREGEMSRQTPYRGGAYHLAHHSKNAFSPREDSATRFAICGETLVQYAFPRIRLISPGSVKSIGLSSRTMGHLNSTNPPPPGGAPRRLTYGAWKRWEPSVGG